MGRARCAWAFSLAAIAVAQLVYNPAGHAQTAPTGEPEVQVQDSDVAPPPAPPPPAGYPPPPAPPADAPAPGHGARPPVAGPIVILRADTSKARLQTQGPLQWRDVCGMPCSRPVDPAAVYRIAGGSIRPSDSFNMPRPSGQVIVTARYGSNIKHWVGIALIIGGLVSVALGGLYINNADDFARNNPNNGADFYKGVGIGSIIHGAIVAGIGIPLALSSTSVDVR